MTRRRSVLAASVLGGFSVLVSAVATRAADVSLGAEVNSAYTWRGITFNDSPVLQPWLDVSGIRLGEGVTLGINVWGNLDLGDHDGQARSGEISEIDLAFTVGLPKGFKVGYIEYTFPATFDHRGTLGTREAFVGWSHEWFVTPSLTAYYDVDEAEDYFVTLDLGRTVRLSEKASVNVGGQAGFAGDDFAAFYDGRGAGLYHFSVFGKLSYKATDKLTLGATVGYTGSLDEEHLPGQEARLYAGVGVSLGL